MKRTLFHVLWDWFDGWYQRLVGRMLGTRWGRWLLGPVETGPCTWRVTCHTRSWTELCGRIDEAVCRRYSHEGGFRIRADEFDDAGVASIPKDVWGMQAYRGLTSGFIVGCWFTGKDPSGGAEVVRLGVGRWSRLGDWTTNITFVAACLLTLAFVVWLFQFPLVRWLADPPFGALAVGSLLLFLVIATFFLALHVVGVAARLFLNPIVAAVGYLERNRLSDREIEAVAGLVRGVVENSPAAADVRDGW